MDTPVSREYLDLLALLASKVLLVPPVLPVLEAQLVPTAPLERTAGQADTVLLDLLATAVPLVTLAQPVPLDFPVPLAPLVPLVAAMTLAAMMSTEPIRPPSGLRTTRLMPP